MIHHGGSVDNSKNWNQGRLVSHYREFGLFERREHCSISRPISLIIAHERTLSVNLFGINSKKIRLSHIKITNKKRNSWYRILLYIKSRRFTLNESSCYITHSIINSYKATFIACNIITVKDVQCPRAISLCESETLFQAEWLSRRSGV